MIMLEDSLLALSVDLMIYSFSKSIEVGWASL
jgi:hypothetical protein